MPIPEITTIEQFHYNLNMGPGYDSYSELLKATNFSEDELKRICHFREDRHSRICLYDSPSLEALATCWKSGQKSAIHNYDFNHGWVKILSGRLSLQYFVLKDGKPEKSNEIDLHTGDTFYLNDNLGYHRFLNKSDGTALALFIYSDKVTHWTAYDVEENKFTEVETAYDHHLDEDLSHDT